MRNALRWAGLVLALAGAWMAFTARANFDDPTAGWVLLAVGVAMLVGAIAPKGRDQKPDA